MPIPNTIAPGGVERVQLEQIGDAVGDQADHGLDRQVDVPGDDDDRLADRRDRDDRGEDRDLLRLSTRGTAGAASETSAPSTNMIATRLSSR